MTKNTDILNPFIKLFRTPIGYYFYDVNTFSLLHINKGMYDILNGHTVADKIHVKSIERLLQKGYLSNHRPQKIEHPYTNILEDYFKGNIRKVTLQITQSCNLTCRYCTYANPIEGRQRHHESKSMPMNIAKKAIDYLFDHSENEPDINIGFYGGEPLLERRKIKELMEYADQKAEKYMKNLTYAMTTNATLLDDETVEFLIKHNVNVLISLDVPREIHNKNRTYRRTGKGCFDDVIRNIENIYDKYPEFVEQISVNSVLDTENDFSCYNEFFTSYSTIKDLRISANNINTKLLATEFSTEESYLIEYKYEKFKLMMALLGNISMQDVSLIVKSYSADLTKIGESFRTEINLCDIVHHGGPCIAGTSRLFVDISGNFFPCERCSEKSEVMNIGNIGDGINLDSVKCMINIGKLTEEECKNCWNISHCLMCATSADNITEYSREKKLKKCWTMKNFTLNTIYDYIALREYGYDYNEKIRS